MSKIARRLIYAYVTKHTHYFNKWNTWVFRRKFIIIADMPRTKKTFRDTIMEIIKKYITICIVLRVQCIASVKRMVEITTLHVYGQFPTEHSTNALVQMNKTPFRHGFQFGTSHSVHRDSAIRSILRGAHIPKHQRFHLHAPPRSTPRKYGASRSRSKTKETLA